MTESVIDYPIPIVDPDSHFASAYDRMLKLVLTLGNALAGWTMTIAAYIERDSEARIKSAECPEKVSTGTLAEHYGVNF